VLGADTNVIVRLLVGDDLTQQQAVLARLQKIRTSRGTVLVGAVVLAEVAWVLSSAYAYDRARVAAALRGVLATPPFIVKERTAVLAAIAAYEQGPADFSDYLILELGRVEGCTKLLTFDRKLLRSAACEVP
jgi:predicted nucleic-acid-binding protein